MVIDSSRKRKLPFLQRNWKDAMSHWQNESSNHSSTTMRPLPSPVPTLEADLNIIKENRHVHNDNVKINGHAITSNNNNNNNNNTTTTTTAASASASRTMMPSKPALIPSEPKPVERSLRIDVLKMVHQESSRVKNGGSLSGISISNATTALTTKARCRITLTSDDAGYSKILSCQSQLCSMKAFKNSRGLLQVARLYLTRPFYVSEESVLVLREADGSFTFAQSYSLDIEIEAAGDESWPPFTASDLGISVPRGASNPTLPPHSILFARVSDIFKRTQSSLRVELHVRPDQYQDTDHLIDIDIRWTSGCEVSRILEKRGYPTIHLNTNATEVSDSSKVVGAEISSTLSRDDLSQSHQTHDDSLDRDVIMNAYEDDDRENASNRSLRQRGNSKTYNLKALSDQAQGMIAKKRKKLDSSSNVGQGRICYLLPAEQVTLDNFCCVTCGESHDSVYKLHNHLLVTHGEYEYHLKQHGQVVEFHVQHRYSSAEFPDESLNLGKPVKAFDLAKLVSGDDSWVKSRETPDSVASECRTLSKKQSSKTTTPSISCNSKKIVIPQTKQAVYHPVSRAILQPGTELEPLSKDTTWQRQKRHDAIAAYSDLGLNEKEFLFEWDNWLAEHPITAQVYLGPTWIAFVREKVDWITSTLERRIEFSNHMAYLLARDELDEKTMNQVMNLINRANKSCADRDAGKREDAGPSGELPETQDENPFRIDKRRMESNAGCTVCRLAVLGPQLLICSNKECENRLYHSDCIRDSAVVSVEKRRWLCNTCCVSARTLKQISPPNATQTLGSLPGLKSGAL